MFNVQAHAILFDEIRTVSTRYSRSQRHSSKASRGFKISGVGLNHFPIVLGLHVSLCRQERSQKRLGAWISGGYIDFWRIFMNF